jgi:hypothetical protein
MTQRVDQSMGMAHAFGPFDRFCRSFFGSVSISKVPQLRAEWGGRVVTTFSRGKNFRRPAEQILRKWSFAGGDVMCEIFHTCGDGAVFSLVWLAL